MISSEVTPKWAAGLYRRWDASIEGKASRLRITIDADGSAVVEVDDAEHLSRSDVRQWMETIIKEATRG